MFNQTYSIRVAVRLTNSNTFGILGKSCTILTSSAGIPTTSLITSDCNRNVNLTNWIKAVYVHNATHYKFEISGGNFTTRYVVESTDRNLRLNNVIVLQYNQTYSIRVAVKFGVDGIYSNWGERCNVITSIIPTTKLRDTDCGRNVTLTTSNIRAIGVLGCNEYKFEISGNAFVTPVEIIRTNVLLNLNQVPGIQTNQEYSIRVAAGFNGTFGNWGDPCIVRYEMNGSSIQRNDITNSVNEF